MLGSSSSQSSGFVASLSTTSYGSSSSQSSGLVASGSGIRACSTQSSGFLSFGSSISFSGLTAGEKCFEETAVLRGLVVNEHLEGVIRLDNESVEGGQFGSLCLRRALEVLLFVLASLGVLVLEDEMNLELSAVYTTTFTSLTLLVAPHLSGPNIIT